MTTVTEHIYRPKLFQLQYYDQFCSICFYFYTVVCIYLNRLSQVAIFHKTKKCYFISLLRKKMSIELEGKATSQP